MFGFPVNLQDSGVQKFTNDADNGFPKIQQREVFYSVKDGDWTDRTIWQTASGRVGLLPGQFDDVYIKNYVSTNFPANSNYFCNNLFVSKESTLRMIGGGGAINLHIFGNIRCFGTLQQTGQYSVLHLYQNDNYIDKSTNLTNIEIRYRRDGDQDIMDLQYYVLNIFGGGNKKINSNLYVSNNFTLWSDISKPLSLDLKGFDFYCGGTATIQALLIKQGPGNLTIVGNFSLGSATLQFNNVNVEMRGGLGCLFSNINDVTGTWTFTTNNQNIAINNTSPAWNCNFIIDGPITITNTNTGQAFVLNNTINGTNALSKLVNNGIINFNSAASVSSMTTGIWDFTTNANTIGYTGNYTATIPSYFTTFHNLTISGTGTKSLGVNTTLNGNLSTTSNGFLELNSYNINILGTSTINTSTLSKNSTGNILFVGQLNVINGTISFTGNPTIEFRGGFTQSGNPPLINFGSNDINITTNNQEFYNNQITINFDNNIFIENNITLTFRTQFGFGNTKFTFNKPINGITSTSKLITRATMYFNTLSSATIMSTGIFDFTTFLNEMAFTGNYSYAMPSTYSSFYYLTITGTGTKTISTNTTIQNNLTITNGSLELSIYNFNVLGSTSLINQSQYSISKSGAGNILFVGLVQSLDSDSLVFDFSLGNPSVEFRNGFYISYFAKSTSVKSGTNTWSFTTNNQNINCGGSATLNCPVLISGAITLTIGNLIAYTPNLTFTNTINGDNVNSKLLSFTSSIINYQSATQPMTTGILDTSTNANTWIYGNGNQDIKGGPTTGAKQVYRNLTLNGGGTKTLQGYVSVQNTYTLTSPATLNNNGFTLTNP